MDDAAAAAAAPPAPAPAAAPSSAPDAVAAVEEQPTSTEAVAEPAAETTPAATAAPDAAAASDAAAATPVSEPSPAPEKQPAPATAAAAAAAAPPPPSAVRDLATPTPSTPAGTPPPPAKVEASEKQQGEEKQEVVPLPEGLTESSPSVRREVGAVASWRANSKDPHAILLLIQSCTTHADLPDARAWYNAFFALQPTAAPQYLALVELELAHENFAEAEEVFKQAFSREVGKEGRASYLHYIRRQNPLPPIPPTATTLPSAYLAARLAITQAYEFALVHVGLDPYSTPIWREYLTFLREGETRSAWEEQGKCTEVRSAVARAVKVPMEGIEEIWREYDQFESSVNRVTAKKFLAERSPTYMTSRSLLKDLRSKLPPSAALFPPAVPSQPTWSDADKLTVRRWREYVEWEKTNPLGFEGDDEGEWKRRVGYALKKAVGGEGRYYPELWHMAAEWERQEDRTDDAIGFLKSGLHANPTSFLLTFALAELEEGRKELPAAHSTFMTLLDALSADLTALKKSIDDEVKDLLASLNAGYAAAAAAGSGSNGVGTGSVGGGNAGGEPDMVDIAELLRGQEREKREKEKAVREKRAKEVEEKERGAGLVWIMYMRFARRSEGIKSGRAVFAKARKFPHATWQVFEASALIEYHCSKDPAVATRIFELGLKIFGERLEFVDRYLAFLIMINDDQNARVLFEKSVTKFRPEESRGLWERWARYEYLFGDLSVAQRLDARFLEAFPKDSITKNLARRHSYIGIDEIARVDLGFGVRSHTGSVPTGPRMTMGTQPPTAPAASAGAAAAGSAIPTGPRSQIPLGAAASITAPAGAVHSPVPAPLAARPAVPATIAPPPVALPVVTAPSPVPSPAKRPLEDARHPSVDPSDRMSLRNEPLSKRHRAESPAVPVAPPAGPAGMQVKREQSPMVQKIPEPHKSTSKHKATLGWFAGLLPPPQMFDGPIFPVEEVMNAIASSRITPIAAPPPSVPPPAIAAPAHAPPMGASGGYYNHQQPQYAQPPPSHYQQQQQQHARAPAHGYGPAAGQGPRAGGWRR